MASNVAHQVSIWEAIGDWALTHPWFNPLINSLWFNLNIAQSLTRVFQHSVTNSWNSSRFNQVFMKWKGQLGLDVGYNMILRSEWSLCFLNIAHGSCSVNVSPKLNFLVLYHGKSFHSFKWIHLLSCTFWSVNPSELLFSTTLVPQHSTFSGHHLLRAQDFIKIP